MVIPLDKRRLVIEQEAAIEVAVKGNPHVGLMSRTASAVSRRHPAAAGSGYRSGNDRPAGDAP